MLISLLNLLRWRVNYVRSWRSWERLSWMQTLIQSQTLRSTRWRLSGTYVKWNSLLKRQRHKVFDLEFFCHQTTSDPIRQCTLWCNFICFLNQEFKYENCISILHLVNWTESFNLNWKDLGSSLHGYGFEPHVLCAGKGFDAPWRGSVRSCWPTKWCSSTVLRWPKIKQIF